MDHLEWIEKPDGMYKTYVFKDFKTAIRFFNEASEWVENMHHHPEWSNIYNKVQVRLCTHDADNTVTVLDRTLAEILDKVARQIHDFH